MGRIPVGLQAVFLASNRGQEVHKPPPGRLVNKIFTFRSPRKWLWNRKRAKSKRAMVKEEKTSETTPGSSSSPISDIFVPVQEPFPTDRGKGKRKCLKRVDSSTSSITFQCSESPTQAVHKSKLSPQAYLDALLQARGYSTEQFDVLKTAYYNKPTPLQQSSYDAYLVGIVKRGEIETLTSLVSTGISQNPANSFGEGLLNLICRLGSDKMLKVMIDSGCDVQVSDDYGRTPMHDACWAAEPAFEVVEMLLGIDPRFFFLRDIRGSLPLAYVQKKDFNAWIKFLQIKKDVFWPLRPTAEPQNPPPLTLQAPNSRPLPDPSNALSLELVRMVASGRMNPNEVELLLNESDDDEEDEDDEEAIDNMLSFGSKYSGASFGGHTFDFSESDGSTISSASSSSLYNDDDDEESKVTYVTEGVETVIDNAFKSLYVNSGSRSKNSPTVPTTATNLAQINDKCTITIFETPIDPYCANTTTEHSAPNMYCRNESSRNMETTNSIKRSRASRGRNKSFCSHQSDVSSLSASFSSRFPAEPNLRLSSNKIKNVFEHNGHTPNDD